MPCTSIIFRTKGSLAVLVESHLTILDFPIWWMHRWTQTSQVDASRYSTSDFPTFWCYKILHQLIDVDTISSYLQQVSWVWLEFSYVFFMPMDLLQQSFLPARTYQAVSPNDILRSIDGRHVQRQRHLGERGGYSQRKLSWEISGFQSSKIATKTKNMKQRTVKKPQEEKHETKQTKGEDQKREKYKKKQSTLKNRREKNKERKRERSGKKRPEKTKKQGRKESCTKKTKKSQKREMT